MDVIDKVSSVANEHNWRAQYFNQVDEVVNSPSEIYLSGRRSLLLEVAGALRRALHPKVAGSGDINIQDSYKAFRKIFERVGYKRTKEKTHCRFGRPRTSRRRWRTFSGRGYESAREEHELRCAAG